MSSLFDERMNQIMKINSAVLITDPSFFVLMVFIFKRLVCLYFLLLHSL